MKRRPAASRSVFILVAVLPLVLAAGCRDFFGTEDLKESIQQEVTVATAPETTVTLRAESDEMGVPNPFGAQSFKVGIGYTIATTVGSDYTFLEWTHSGEEGDITFSDASAVSTTMTVHVEKEDLVVSPTFDRRPHVLTWAPYSGSSSNLINKEITITFNEPILESSVTVNTDDPTAGTVQVTTVKTARITTETPRHVESKFDVSVNAAALTLALKDGQYHEIFSTITITLTRGIQDLAGNTMVSDFSWFFTTGSGKDENPPVIELFTITNSNDDTSDVSATSAFTRGNDITLNIEATDDQADVTQLRITETPWSTGDADGSATGDAVIHDTQDYVEQTSFTLATQADRWTKLQIEVADENDNWSTLDEETPVNTMYVYRDATPPTIGTFNIVSGAGFTNTTTPAVEITVSDAGVGGIQYGLSYSAEPPGSWSDTKPGTADFSGQEDGLKTVTLYVRDALGNTADTSDDVTVDRIAPIINVGTIETTGNPGWVRNGQTITIPFTIDEPTAGLAATPTVTIAGQSAEVTGSLPDFTATYEFTGTTVSQGAIDYTIDASDNAGNAADQVANATGIEYDRVAPTFAVGDPSVDFAKNGATVTYDVTYSADAIISLSTADVTATGSSGAQASVTDVTGTGDTRTITLTAGSGDGNVTIALAAGTARDAAGNPTVASEPSTAFAVDNTVPTVSIGAPSV
ncbi:MAG: Ig-like domain-containing protein, partial [bacterium]